MISKGQIILMSIATVSVVGMFNLPKSILKNADKANKLESMSGGVAEKAKSDDDNHAHKLTKEQQKTLGKLKKEFLRTENRNQLPFADSLALFFDNVQQWDSAAYYSEFIAEKAKTDIKYWTQAGDFYYQAFTFALDIEKSKRMALKAQACYQKVLDIDASQLDTKAKMAMTYTVTETPMQAINILKENLVANPKHELTLFNLGVLSMQSNQHAKAIARFEELVNINPNHVEALFYLADSYLNVGKKDKALEVLKKLQNMPIDNEIKKAVEENIQKIK